MAASRIASSAKRFFHRYHMFFFVAFMLVTVQLYLGYSFYSIKQEELRQLEEEWSRKRNDRAGVRGIRKYDKIPDADMKREIKQGIESVQEDGQHANYSNSIDAPQLPSQKHFNKNLNNARISNASSHQFILEEPLVNLLQFEDIDNPRKHLKDDEPKNPLRAEPGGLFDLPSVNYYSPKCSIIESKDKEAYSAIHRAETEACKQEIADVVCLQRVGKLFPKRIMANSCPLRTEKRGHYLGCFRDDQKKRVLGTLVKSYPTDNSLGKCINVCLSSGFDHAGVEWGLECWCAEKFDTQTVEVLPEEECNTPCPGTPHETCGGYNALNIYQTGAGARNYHNPPLVDSSDVAANVTKARIAFILTLSGRAVRQVKRLIKALYHTDHYFLIHVDARQDYLHRELTKATTLYSNIRMAPTRFATIWGGANLSTMLLKCIEYLLKLSDWKWDFFINLSESDYPVRPIEQLVAFLSSNREKNFLKSHGKDTPRFIQKQGLERTFVQCDNHMWRVGKRQLPLGIRVDGGSDWVALNREFCQYLVNSNDQLLIDIKHYWKYTLLPGESFWHTVLQNSQFCTTFANNNLHVVNWNRRKGCKCQYKAIVDWCGCSPNDFLTSDMHKFISMHEKKKIVFFARKFEAIVSQEIINQLDAYLYGSYPQGTPALSSYWENRYTIEDTATIVSDSHMTFYQTFARSALKQITATSQTNQCSMRVTEINQVHVYQQLDQFQGLLTQFRAVSQSNEKIYTLEAYAQYQTKFRVYSNSSPVSRLKAIEVGTNFDPKEDFFRNHGDLMGPHSSLTLALFWNNGPSFKVTISLIDPAQVVALTLDIKVTDEEAEHAQTFDLDLETPLRPGIWSVKIQYAWTIIAVYHFLLTPYSHYGGRKITDAEAVLLHNGPPGGRYRPEATDDNNMADLLQLDDPQFAMDIALKNSKRTGDSLLEWIEDLTFKFWHLRDICITSAYSPCTTLPICDKTSWSSLAPDPKSDLGSVNRTTGRLR